MQLPLSIRALEGLRLPHERNAGCYKRMPVAGAAPHNQLAISCLVPRKMQPVRRQIDIMGYLAGLAEAAALASAVTRVAAGRRSSNSRDSVIHRKLCEAKAFSTITRIAVGNCEIMSSTDANRTSKHDVPCSSRTAKRHDFVSCSRFLASSRTT